MFQIDLADPAMTNTVYYLFGKTDYHVFTDPIPVFHYIINAGDGSITVYPIPGIKISYTCVQRNLGVPFFFNFIGQPVPVVFGTVVTLLVVGLSSSQMTDFDSSVCPVHNYCDAPGVLIWRPRCNDSSAGCQLGMLYNCITGSRHNWKDTTTRELATVTALL